MGSETNRPRGVLGTLALLMAFSSIATDLYLPAIPQIADALGAQVGLIEASVASYLAGFVMGQLAWGPIGDAYGRKRPILLGIALFLGGSIGCALAGSAEAIVAWRTVQGLGGSAAVVLSRAMVRDLYSGDEAASKLSTLIAIMALAPLVGPLIGARILAAGDWRAIFWTLCALAGLALFASARMPESLPPGARSAGGRYLAAYHAAARNASLLRFTMTGACFYAGLFAFITGAPAVFIEGYGFSPTLFAALLGVGTALVIAANLANLRLVRTIGYVRSLRFGATAAAVAGAATLAASLLAPESVVLLIAGLMAFMATAGLVIANSLTGAMDSYAERPGAASAFAGALQFAGGGIGAALVALSHSASPAAMSLVIFASGLGCYFFARSDSVLRGEKANHA